MMHIWVIPDHWNDPKLSISNGWWRREIRLKMKLLLLNN